VRRALVAQLSDTHVVRAGATYFGHDTAAYLADAVAAIQALARPPDCVVVTGDLVNSGAPAEYAYFREVMQALRVPYFVIPGNHDDREAMRAALPPETYGGSRHERVRYAIDDFEVRIVGLDANARRPWPGAAFDADTLAWLDDALAAAPAHPTMVCVHQPPFRTGLHYLDAFGFRGARLFRRLVERNAHVGRVVSGHIHCVRKQRMGAALACSGPSTAPQLLPLLFMDGKVAGMRAEAPGFALHAWSEADGFTTTVHRRDASGRYAAPTP
jgi:3',5'-cyclic AMP phosphodiesterase CpdA